MSLPTSTPVTVKVVAKPPKKADVLVVFAGESVEPADHGDAVERLRGGGLFDGSAGQVAMDLLDGGAKLAAAGVGDGEAGAWRNAGAAAAKRLAKLGAKAVTLRLDGATPEQAGAAVTGYLLGAFDFREYRGSAAKGDGGEGRIMLAVVAAKDAKAAVERAGAVAEGQNFARTIASRPGNDLDPPALAEIARQMGRELGLGVKVLDEKQAKKLGMGGLLAVGGGSASPPRMIVLEHKPAGSKKGKQGKKNGKGGGPLLVVGKSVTFDTGGISIKPSANMGRMIFDKCGGMAVLGLMWAAAKLKLGRHVVGVLAAAENMPGPTAYRPGDVLTMHNGVTVEVTNTDAEGRLVLADALSWGVETYAPAAVVDLATLTGGCVVALGEQRAGAWATDDDLWEQVRAASGRAGEALWRLPLGEDFADALRSANSADVVNSAGKWGSACTAAQFLKLFVPDGTPWCHLDIAGPAETGKDLPLYQKGATGFAVRTLVEWAENA